LLTIVHVRKRKPHLSCFKASLLELPLKRPRELPQVSLKSNEIHVNTV
jgi:hypothetical protein